MSENPNSVEFIEEETALLDMAEQQGTDSQGNLGPASTTTETNEVSQDVYDKENETAKYKKTKPKKLSKKLIFFIGFIIVILCLVGWAVYSGFSIKNIIDDGKVSFFTFKEPGPTVEEVLKQEIDRNISQTQGLSTEITDLSRNFTQVKDDYNRDVISLKGSLENQINELRGLLVQNKQALRTQAQEIEKLRTAKNVVQQTKMPDSYQQVLDNQVNFKKNEGWFANRLKKLEKSDLTQAEEIADLSSLASTLPSIEQVSKRVTVDVTSPWILKGASDKVAVLFNVNTEKSMRVTIGMDVPYCGPVLTIEPRSNTVVTQSCRVKR